VSNIIRTAREGCFKQTSDPWGQAFEPVADPMATVPERPPFQFTGPVIPARLFVKVIKLFRYLASPRNKTTSGTSEVQVVLTRHVDTDEFRIWVPKQEVDHSSIDANYQVMTCIETGETFTNGLPEEWCYCGTIHSHNTFGAFWSGTDNEDQVNGNWGLHLVIGMLQMKQFEVKARVTRQKQVIDIDWPKAVESHQFFVASRTTFHRDVLQRVTEAKPTIIMGYGSSMFGSFPGHRDLNQGWSYLCREDHCAEDAETGSMFCKKHQNSEITIDKVACVAKMCFQDREPRSRYCKFHINQEATPLFDQDQAIMDARKLEGADQELMVDISILVDEFLEDFGLDKLPKDTANAIVAVILSRGEL
jgi:hypothetical protein